MQTLHLLLTVFLRECWCDLKYRRTDSRRNSRASAEKRERESRERERERGRERECGGSERDYDGSPQGLLFPLLLILSVCGSHLLICFSLECDPNESVHLCVMGEPTFPCSPIMDGIILIITAVLPHHLRLTVPTPLPLHCVAQNWGEGLMNWDVCQSTLLRSISFNAAFVKSLLASSSEAEDVRGAQSLKVRLGTNSLVGLWGGSGYGKRF